MRPNKAKTAVHGCHITGNRLYAGVQNLAKPWGCVDNVTIAFRWIIKGVLERHAIT